MSIKDESGTWYIDYAANGFGKWDWQSKKGAYGGENSIPVPADYDGDGKTDLSVVNKDTGIWYVDYAANGFGKWDQQFRGNYANQYSKYFLPGDYDGDGILDLSCIVPGGGWNIVSSHYNSRFGLRTITSRHIPTPADYDGDGILDMSYKLNPLNYDDNPYGTWVIFYSGEKP
nr:VCBS repeat-containing protein [Apibacter sp. HY039]